MNTRAITVERQKNKTRFVTYSATQTHALAKRLLKDFRGGDVLALSGELGAGKTTFTQGLAKALGITKPITSPTFVLMKVYKLKKAINGIVQLCHIDAYRLESSDELASIGAGEYIGGDDTLTLIEWPERVKEIIPRDSIVITFKHAL